MDIDTAIPIGLILNELFTNSFKYAFSPQKENKLTIQLIQGEKEQKLIIKDNGSGIKDDIDLNKVKSIGLRLVKNLSKQLHGSLAYVFNDGAQFSITFKETKIREAVD